MEHTNQSRRIVVNTTVDKREQTIIYIHKCQESMILLSKVSFFKKTVKHDIDLYIDLLLTGFQK